MKQAMISYIQNEKNDELYTPEYAIIPLLKYLKKDVKIWECTDFDFDMIITNPPYSLKDEFISKCYEYGKPFCLLLPITSLEGVKRGKMFRKNGIELLVFDKRCNFIYNNAKKSNWFNTSWFCHNVLPKQLIFEELNKD